MYFPPGIATEWTTANMRPGALQPLSVWQCTNVCTQFSAILRTQLKAAMPAMKTLKPILKTFYLRNHLGRSQGKGKGKDSRTRDQPDRCRQCSIGRTRIQYEGRSRKGLARRFVGTISSFHAGKQLICGRAYRGMIYKYPGDPRKSVLSIIL